MDHLEHPSLKPDGNQGVSSGDSFTSIGPFFAEASAGGALHMGECGSSFTIWSATRERETFRSSWSPAALHHRCENARSVRAVPASS